jgi:hypothetical protein
MTPPKPLALVLGLALFLWSPAATHAAGPEAWEQDGFEVEEDDSDDDRRWEEPLTPEQVEEMRRVNAEIELARLRRKVAAGEVKLPGPGPSVGRRNGSITIRMPPGSTAGQGAKGRSKSAARSGGKPKSKAAKSRSGSGSRSWSTSKSTTSSAASSSRNSRTTTTKPAQKPAARTPAKTTTRTSTAPAPAKQPVPAPTTAKKTTAVKFGG